MTPNTTSLSAGSCKNCGKSIRDQGYCPYCGQKSDTHVLSFRELLEELADGLLNLDSRLWRTLIPLATNPGKLTTEFLAGKRMFYLPPFRLYLILSLLFFLLPGNNFNFYDEVNEELNAASNELLPVITPENDPTEIANLNLPNEIAGDVQRRLEALRSSRQAEETSCNITSLPQDMLITVMIRNTCLKVQDDPEQLINAFTDSIPIMMMVGLPLVALIMQLFYVFAGRKYVEHVIFLFHVHAFYFLISIAMAISGYIGQRYTMLFTPMDWFRIITAFYIPVYVFLAMRRVYGDSNLKTLLKALCLLFGYAVCVTVVLGLGFLLTALSLG